MTVRRRRYDDRLSRSVDDDGWSAWDKPVHEGYRLACCGCGLIHNVNFRIRGRMVELQFQTNKRATAAHRRGKRFAPILAALKASRGNPYA